MITQAYFEDIHHYIKRALEKAKNSVFIAVAWFTDPELFEVLCRKAEEGIAVELMLIDDKINNGYRIDYGRLSAIRGQQSANSEKMSANNWHKARASRLFGGSYEL